MHTAQCSTQEKICYMLKNFPLMMKPDCLAQNKCVHKIEQPCRHHTFQNFGENW